MIRVQIELDDEEVRQLQGLAEECECSVDALIGEVIGELLSLAAKREGESRTRPLPRYDEPFSAGEGVRERGGENRKEVWG